MDSIERLVLDHFSTYAKSCFLHASISMKEDIFQQELKAEKLRRVTNYLARPFLAAESRRKMISNPQVLCWTSSQRGWQIRRSHANRNLYHLVLAGRMRVGTARRVRILEGTRCIYLLWMNDIIMILAGRSFIISYSLSVAMLIESSWHHVPLSLKHFVHASYDTIFRWCLL